MRLIKIMKRGNCMIKLATDMDGTLLNAAEISKEMLMH